ncbi:MAG: hypothetical protein V4510_12930 [bacterium]
MALTLLGQASESGLNGGGLSLPIIGVLPADVVEGCILICTLLAGVGVVSGIGDYVVQLAAGSESSDLEFVDSFEIGTGVNTLDTWQAVWTKYSISAALAAEIVSTAGYSQSGGGTFLDGLASVDENLGAVAWWFAGSDTPSLTAPTTAEQDEGLSSAASATSTTTSTPAVDEWFLVAAGESGTTADNTTGLTHTIAGLTASTNLSRRATSNNYDGLRGGYATGAGALVSAVSTIATNDWPDDALDVKVAGGGVLSVGAAEPAVNPFYLRRHFHRNDLPYDLRTIRLGGE